MHVCFTNKKSETHAEHVGRAISQTHAGCACMAMVARHDGNAMCFVKGDDETHITHT